MLVPPVVVGDGSEQPPKPQPIPFTAPSEVLSQVTTAAASQPPKDQNTYRRTQRGHNNKVPQSGGSPNKVGDEAINEEMFDSVERAATTVSSLEAEQASIVPSAKTPWGMQAQTRSEGVSNLSNNVPNTPHDSPLPRVNTPGSDEGSLELNELMDLVTKLSHMVFDLEKVKTTQAKEIAGLKRRVTKLEQRQRSRILKNYPFRFGSSRRQSLGIAFVQEKDTEVLDTEKAANTAGEGVSTACVSETVSTAAPRTPPTTTTTVFDDEDVTMAMAQTLIKMKEEKAKEKGVVIKGVKDSSRPETESVEKTKKKVQGDAQIEKDAEVALRLQAELDEELRVERERQEEASKVAIAEMFDEVQARMDADYELAARMTQEEQEKYTIKERARLLVEFFETRKKQLAAERAEAIKNKPPTKTQQQKRIQDFTPMDSEKEAQKPGKMEAKDMYVYKLTRADESSSYHRDTQAFLRRLDRQDSNDLYMLVHERFQDHPLKGRDLLLWGDLRMIFDPNEKDGLCMNQLDWKLLRWKLYESCGGHPLFMDGTPIEINMLVEKKYPLIKELLEKMLNLQLKAEEESTMAFELINEETKNWNHDMINYFKYQWEAMERQDKENSDEEDVFENTDQATQSFISDEIEGNVTDVEGEFKQKELKKFIAEERIQVCAILETYLKTKSINKAYDYVFGSWRWISNVAHSHTSCRIVVGWNVDEVDVMVIQSCSQTILCLVEIIQTKVMFFVSFVYASNSCVERRNLWNELTMHKNSVSHKAWVLMGDFNVTLKPEEHSNGSSNMTVDMCDFKDAVNKLEVEDLYSSVFQFTWTKSLKNSMCSTLKKLDRIMVNDEFLLQFEKAYGIFLPYLISDHSPSIMTFPKSISKKRESFRFANYVADKEEFLDVVREGWNHDVRGCHMYRVVQKLKVLKKPLNQLNWQNGNLFEKVNILKEKLKEAQSEVDADPFNFAKRENAVNLGNEYSKSAEDELKLVHQKAKIRWLEEGDRNTSYFHNILKARKHKSRIESIYCEDGRRVEGSLVNDQFVKHFQTFLGSSFPVIPLSLMGDMALLKLTENEATNMIKDISDKEIKEALFDIDSSKAAGLDGYPS
ncbi:RNA-directed DNA polymerase, eukaryota, reverse transcriptase zinc-binding domain protein [Tanacetum coccineum]